MSDDNERLLETSRRLMQSLTPGDLDHTLSQITHAAVETLPQVEQCSITIRHADGRLETSSPTDDMLYVIDKAQYEYREGPCYHAATDELHVVSSNVLTDERFPRYGQVAGEAGIRSQAGVRLFDTGKSVGALNLYSSSIGAFDDFETLAALFSHQAAVAIGYAHEIQNLNEAIRTRKMIGQAVGIIMERYQLTDDRAFAFLTRLSQTRNVKLRLVAQEMIAQTEQQGDE